MYKFKKRKDLYMKFVIRKAEEKDLNIITALYEKRGEYPLSPFGREKKEIFSSMLHDSSRCILVGEKDGKIAVFLSMKIENRLENFLLPSAVILDIKIKSHESEILCAVISRAVAVAMENGCREITLFDKNVSPETHSVYSICGFRESTENYIKKI